MAFAGDLTVAPVLHDCSLAHRPNWYQKMRRTAGRRAHRAARSRHLAGNYSLRQGNRHWDLEEPNPSQGRDLTNHQMAPLIVRKLPLSQNLEVKINRIQNTIVKYALS